MRSYEDIYDANSLYESFQKCKAVSAWKDSIQKYELNLIKNIANTQRKLKNLEFEKVEFNEFILNERGKIRKIKAIPIEHRIIQKSLCDNVLEPILREKLIYDNGASLSGKGVSFSRSRFETHLHKFYRNYKNDGYVLLIDFSKYFDNINHSKLLEMVKPLIDENTYKLVEHYISSFKVDVSYMLDEEYEHCYETLYDSLGNECKDGKRYMYKSLGIGSQISQILGIYYPTKVDNFVKIIKGCKYYGRYMDDSYVIHHDKMYLQELLKEITKQCNDLGIHINKKKTQIIKLTKPFTFLKVKYRLTESGKIIKKFDYEIIKRIKRKLYKFRELIDDKQMTYLDVYNNYISCKNTYKGYTNFYLFKRLDKLYDDLFIYRKD